ncbi:DUF4351 domain-containing protein [Nostoc sp. CALU 1950]|uniref:DUF4351 domain-containing protein n=1 Tax=Nostoc sp. CALU 1950 TaxID=3104321 RepID=UPI003EBF5100
MKESVIYQDIVQKEAFKLIIRQLKRRFSDIDGSLVEQVRNLSAEQYCVSNNLRATSRAMSVSYLPRKGLAYEQLIDNFQELYQRFCDESGFVYMAYRTSVHLGEVI